VEIFYTPAEDSAYLRKGGEVISVSSHKNILLDWNIAYLFIEFFGSYNVLFPAETLYCCGYCGRTISEFHFPLI
jgi:hypothetical protein